MTTKKSPYPGMLSSANDHYHGMKSIIENGEIDHARKLAQIYLRQGIALSPGDAVSWQTVSSSVSKRTTVVSRSTARRGWSSKLSANLSPSPVALCSPKTPLRARSFGMPGILSEQQDFPMPPRALYRTDQLEIVKRKLPGILTSTVKEVACLAKQCYPDEVDRLAAILAEAPARLHHKWLAQVMGSLPIKAWVTGPDDELYVSAPKEASMRLMSERLPLRERTKRTQLEDFRTELFQKLLSNMTPLKRRFHEPILALASPEELKPFFLGWTEPPAETNFGLELLHLEALLDSMASYEEQEWVEESAYPPSLTVVVWQMPHAVRAVPSERSLLRTQPASAN
ncbi:hypothetical protein NLO72_22065 [Pseudomonas tremae]|uniref:hypothetical protein n=1 Tax=Pseudomonas tremae TaxID=200454 RepID=UPI00210F18F7|nr:hypothetical protein [Pseudomonas tremae]MCQ2991894.1 hypothetical protein [Pseudomonas tremae]